MREKQQCRQEKQRGRSKCGKKDSAAASSKMGRSKLGKMGEEQAAIQTGEASSKMGRHGKQDRIRSKQQARWGRLEQAANGARWVKQ